jgi:hypothetical protein
VREVDIHYATTGEYAPLRRFERSQKGSRAVEVDDAWPSGAGSVFQICARQGLPLAPATLNRNLNRAGLDWRALHESGRLYKFGDLEGVKLGVQLCPTYPRFEMWRIVFAELVDTGS